jgi:hypothetical protein
MGIDPLHFMLNEVHVRRLSRLLIAVPVLALAGCASLYPNLAGVGKLPAAAFTASETGVVVFSAGAASRCYMLPTYVVVSAEDRHTSVARIPMISVDAQLVKSDFRDHQGSLSALQLPAGAYYLTPTVLNPTVQTTRRPTFAFDVRAGETVYAGELFMPRSCAAETTFAVRDQYERDIALATERNPALGTRPVTKRLMRLRTPGQE